PWNRSTSNNQTHTCFVFFFQAEDGIRDFHVTGVQTCALPIWPAAGLGIASVPGGAAGGLNRAQLRPERTGCPDWTHSGGTPASEIGRASCRESAKVWGGAVGMKKE